jgi:hypothetical protein
MKVIIEVIVSKDLEKKMTEVDKAKLLETISGLVHQSRRDTGSIEFTLHLSIRLGSGPDCRIFVWSESDFDIAAGQLLDRLTQHYPFNTPRWIEAVLGPGYGGERLHATVIRKRNDNL